MKMQFELSYDKSTKLLNKEMYMASQVSWSGLQQDMRFKSKNKDCL